MTLTVGSLFSGVGGMDLGLERAQMEVRWQVEIDPYCRQVLAKHWPDVTRYEDVRDVGADELEPVDLLCGGFPCPVVSQAARGRNVAAWLWPEMARIVRDLRPGYVLVENVSGLRYRGRGLGEVLGDLAAMGYDAAWRDFPASWLGAPHRRARLWLAAYAHGYREPDLSFDDEASVLPQSRGAGQRWPDPPRTVGMDDGPSGRLDRLAAAGRAVVPRVAEWIGRRILEAHERMKEEAAA